MPAAFNFNGLNFANESVPRKTGEACGQSGGQIRMEEQRMEDIRPDLPNDPRKAPDDAGIPRSGRSAALDRHALISQGPPHRPARAEADDVNFVPLLPHVADKPLKMQRNAANFEVGDDV